MRGKRRDLAPSLLLPRSGVNLDGWTEAFADWESPRGEQAGHDFVADAHFKFGSAVKARYVCSLTPSARRSSRQKGLRQELGVLVEMQSGRDIRAMDLIAPVLVAILFVSACSFLREPNRRNFNAIMIAGAGAAYLNGGFGKWEFVFTAIVTYFAYRGLQSYNFIGVGWLFHTVWDVLHHLYGNPIVPFAPASSLGCAICDPLIALWCFAGAPSISHLPSPW
jgi:hypothetical protein